MKSVLFLTTLLLSFVASAALEVPYDRNDSLPTDQLLANNMEIRSKVVTYQGQNYIIMYKAEWGNAPLSTKVIATCSIEFRDTVEYCINDKKPVLLDVYKANVRQVAPMDCAKIARVNHDNAKTMSRLEAFNGIYQRRDQETNARDLSHILSSLTFQSETINQQIGNLMYTESMKKTKQLLDLIANRSISVSDAIRALAREIPASRQMYTELLAQTQCSADQLRMCYVQKDTATVLNPSVSVEKYNEFMQLHAKGLVEMKPCVSITQPTPAPTIDVPKVQPQIQQQTQPVEVEAINPTVQ